MKLKRIIIDCGHGGLLNGVYTTGNKKMYTFPNGETAYEGVINRKIGKILGEKLKENGFDVVFTVEPNDPTDLPLKKRSLMTKKYSKNDTLFLSIHCNAFNSKARGSEIWTTKGQTKSDMIAENIITSIEFYAKSLKIRTDKSDGDKDKESQFYVLRNTNLFACLLECIFFDNWDDFQLSKSECFIDSLTNGIVDGLISTRKAW